MSIIENEKLVALRDRLQAALHELVAQAANADAMPGDKALRKIADIEMAIGAVEAMLER